MVPLRWVCVAVGLEFLAACGSKEHPPFIAEQVAGKAPKAPAGARPSAKDAGVDANDQDAGSRSTTSGSGTTSGNGAQGGSGPLAPQALYLVGSLKEGSCNYGALTAVSTPEDYLVGVPCMASAFAVRDDTLLFLADGPDYKDIWEFNPDPKGASLSSYPANVLYNDGELKITCGAGLEPVTFLVSPSGHLIYYCYTTGWHEEDGKPVYNGDEMLLALGDDDVALTANGIMNLKDVATVAVPDINNGLPVRAHGSTFHVVVQGADALELWSVDAGGTRTKLGDYAPPPPDLNRPSTTLQFLANDDSLVQSAGDPKDTTIDVLYRRTIDGVSEVIYTEADEPVKIDRDSSAIVQSF